MQKSYYAIIPATVRYDKDLTPNAKLLYGEISALCNEKGYCWATNQYFAELYDVSKTSISKWISQLVEKKFIRIDNQYFEGTQGIEKRFISIVNDPIEIEERAFVPIEEKLMPPITKVKEGIEEKLNTPIEEKLKDNNTVINTTNNNTTNKVLNTYGQKAEKPKKPKKPSLPKSLLEQEFEELWKQYPRKEKKDMAKTSYIKARKENTTYEEVEKGLQRFIEHIQDEGTEKQFIPHGSTWFNQKRWQDEYTSTGISKKPRSISEYLQQKYGGNEHEYSRNRKIVNDDPRDLFTSLE